MSTEFIFYDPPNPKRLQVFSIDPIVLDITADDVIQTSHLNTFSDDIRGPNGQRQVSELQKKILIHSQTFPARNPVQPKGMDILLDQVRFHHVALFDP
jgi:hypothetical protein